MIPRSFGTPPHPPPPPTPPPSSDSHCQPQFLTILDPKPHPCNHNYATSTAQLNSNAAHFSSDYTTGYTGLYPTHQVVHSVPQYLGQAQVARDSHTFVFKQEPGLEGTSPLRTLDIGSPLIKREPGLLIKQECGVLENTLCYEQEGLHQECKQEMGAPLDFGAAFPSQPLDFNFMADIEDIVQPSTSDITIDSIQRELSSFDGPLDSKQSLGGLRAVKVKEEEDPTWEPPLWKQQYENIRTMRSKRDAPVDKYGCFMNAEREVAPEVRRYQVLVSLMLSSQTKDEVVGKAMTKLKENGLTIRNVLSTPQEEIARMIFPVGFWNKKSDYIKKTTKILEEKFGSDIPNSVGGLISLPGIGPKMAHLIMDFAWDEVSGIAVDTHVHRITHRLGWMKKEARSPEEARKCLEKWFPRSEWSDLNLFCVGFGQQICNPVGPKCSECLNKDLCPSSSCLVSSGLPLGIGFEVGTKSKGKRASTSNKTKAKKIKVEK